ncbi:MAG: PocR ligand-binding domain-containing protein [Phycisphaerae bacterium]|jgi:AraC-like DNA-binding protein|nr:PocR ligand-binding domain-containing protein [Phycisphaerae bacterium]
MGTRIDREYASGLEFVFHPQVEAIFDCFCDLHDIRLGFYTAGGGELRVGKARSNCRYCHMLQTRLGYRETCIRLDRQRREEAEGLQTNLLSYECHGGMIDAVMPVRLGGRVIGFVMIGQFRTGTSPPASVLHKAKTGRMVGRLLDAYAEAPRFSPEQVRHLLGLFEVLVQFIAERRMIQLKDVLGPLLSRLREHPEEHLSLSTAAAMVGRSATTLSHLFRRTLGKSFRQVRIEMALDKADEYFRNDAGIRVSDVAARLGFDDPLYFSRLYRKYRGIPPGRRIRK